LDVHRFYIPEAFDAGYRLANDAHMLWRAFEEAHNFPHESIVSILWKFVLGLESEADA
jgi:hypothetical protein